MESSINTALLGFSLNEPNNTPLFLHFLNRELNRAVNREIPAGNFESELKVLAVLGHSNLYSNFANILEGGYLSSDLFRKFIEFKIIHFHGEQNTLDDYIVRRAPMYQFDKNRYLHLEKTVAQYGALIQPTEVRSFSMTSRLKGRLNEMGYDRVDSYKQLNGFGDASIYWELIEKLASNKGGEAVTMSLIHRVLEQENAKAENKESLARVVGQLLSILYFQQIINDIGADIPTGIEGLTFFDNWSKHFPLYDIRLLSACLYACGYNLERYSIDEIVTFRFSHEHRACCFVFQRVLSAMAQTLINNNDTIPRLRSKIVSRLVTVVDQHRARPSLANLLPKTDKLIQNIGIGLPGFKERVRMNTIVRSVLIITATSRESRAIIFHARKLFGSEKEILIKGSSAVNYLGLANGHKIYHTQCEAGATGPSGAQAVTSELIHELNPQYVLMPGIAFGLKPDEQKIGDILVATHVMGYERQRVGSDKIILRGEKMPASPVLLSTLRTVALAWDKSPIHFGTILSGEKLVDNQEFVDQLRKIDPEAIGGEMEGTGVFSAAYRKNVDWILFKSIVDWGVTKNDLHQEKSAHLTAELLFEILPVIT